MSEGDIKVVYEDEEIKTFFKLGSPNLCIITFGDLTMISDHEHFYAQKVFEKSGHSALGFIAKSANWYPVANVARCAKVISELLEAYSIRVTYGGSMGGYAALKFSAMLQAHCVIALCPQWSIDRSECGDEDPGWTNHYTDGMKGMGIRPSDGSGRAYILVDTFDRRDKFHANAIAINRDSGTTIVPVSFVGHNATTVLAGSENLLELIQNCLSGNVASISRVVRKAKRNSDYYIVPILKLLMERFPRQVLEFLLSAGGIEVLKKNWRYCYRATAYCLEQQHRDSNNVALVMVNNVLPNLIEKLVFLSFYSKLTDFFPILITAHGTQMYLDLELGYVRHRSKHISEWEIPVRIQFTDSKFILSVPMGRSEIPLTVCPNTRRLILETGPRSSESIFEVCSKPEWSGSFEISQGDKYVCAEDTGTIVCNRTSAMAWERFSFSLCFQPGSVTSRAQQRHTHSSLFHSGDK